MSNIISCIFVIIIFCLILFFILYCELKKQRQKKVKNTSLIIKKLEELNNRFPSWDISYNHTMRERVEYKARKSVTGFDPDKILKSRLKELQEKTIRRKTNLYYYRKYVQLFDETVQNTKTPIDTIRQTKIKEKKYRKLESDMLYSYFQRKEDKEEITYIVYAHYVSKKGKSELTSQKYIYHEKDFHAQYKAPKLNFDYSYKEEKKEEKNPIKKVVPVVEPVTIDPVVKKEEAPEEEVPIIKEEKTSDMIQVDNLFYEIKGHNAIVRKAVESTLDIMIPSSIHYNDSTYYILEIGKDAFLNNHQIKTVFLEEGIQKIGESAFRNCIHLESIQLASTIIEIQKKAFSGCLSLKKLKLPDNIKIIQEEAFSLCSSLTDIYLPSTAKTVQGMILWYSDNAKIHITQGKEISHFDSQWNVDENPIDYEFIK